MTMSADPLDRMAALLDRHDAATTNTSMRLPDDLKEAAELAVRELGLAPSVTALTVDALRQRLELALTRAALDHHYSAHPETRPSLAEVALALAELDQNPMAERPDLIEVAAGQAVQAHPDADAELVLIWAEALAVGHGS